MCARRFLKLAPLIVLIGVATSCGAPQRTGTNFCRQLANEIPEIGQPMSTPQQVSAMVDRYERLLRVAPLAIEKDLAVLTELIRQAEKSNPNNPDDLQSLADASYAANQSSLTVRDWVKSTCAVDITTGENIEPPRVAPTTTLAPSTTDVAQNAATTTVP
ncbi:MAG: hypothetical protein RIR69_780 [Actinomycetota bacterium]|jgi:hypothetical protein